MSNFYKIIENQVNVLLRFLMGEDEKGEIQYGSWIQGPKWVQLTVQLFTLLLFITVVAFFGKYLWNQGLAPVFSGIVNPIGESGVRPQTINPYFQLIITLFALMMFFK